MLSERELEAALRRVEPPGADAAAERAWRDVEAALDAPGAAAHPAVGAAPVAVAAASRLPRSLLGARRRSR